VVINPEILMLSDDIEKLWKKPRVTSRILNIIFDEGHCVSQWSTFPKEYLHLGSLRYLIPETIPFYVASATLPPSVLLDVINILRLRPNMTEHIIWSNDRPETYLAVQSLKYPTNSFRDLAFLISKNLQEGDSDLPPEKFLIFFDNTKEAERAVRFLRNLLPLSLHGKIKWFHSTMTQPYQEDELDALKGSEIWELCATDAFGMVSSN
jgi:superfamily II DNA helicase RecQ